VRISFAGRPVTVNTNRLQSLIAYLILHGDTPERCRPNAACWKRIISRFDGGTTFLVRSISLISTLRLPRLALRERRKIARGRYILPALYDDWLTPVRDDHRRRISEVLRRLATPFEEHREYAAAIPCAERLVALDSLCEAHHQLLIRLHAANHDRSCELRAYHQCMRVLRREMAWSRVRYDPGNFFRVNQNIRPAA
jgi:hypothetical protein